MRRILLTLLLVSSLAVPIKARSPRVRPQSDRVADLVQDAAARSPTVAALLKAVEESDVILQVEFRVDDAVPRAMTHFVTASGSARYVRTVINPRLPTRRRIELLGHELQHVVEIASDPAVRDLLSMRERFEALGWSTERGGAYETDAAIATERQVRIELSVPRRSL